MSIRMDYERGGRQKGHYSKDEVVERPCPLCDGIDYSRVYRERGAIGIARCKDCGLIYTNPMVREPEKNYWGDEKKYLEEARLIFEGKGKSHRDVNYISESLLSKLMSLRVPKGRSNPFFEIASVVSLPRNDTLRNRMSKCLFRRGSTANLDTSDLGTVY